MIILAIPAISYGNIYSSQVIDLGNGGFFQYGSGFDSFSCDLNLPGCTSNPAKIGSQHSFSTQSGNEYAQVKTSLSGPNANYDFFSAHYLAESWLEYSVTPYKIDGNPITDNIPITVEWYLSASYGITFDPANPDSNGTDVSITGTASAELTLINGLTTVFRNTQATKTNGTVLYSDGSISGQESIMLENGTDLTVRLRAVSLYSLLNFNNALGLASDIKGAHYMEAFADPLIQIDPTWALADLYGLEFSTIDAVQQTFVIGDYVSPVPVPAAVWLFGSGLVGLLGLARKKPRL